MFSKRSYVKYFVFSAVLGAVVVACSPKQDTTSTETPSQPPEAYCSPTTVSPSSPVTLTITGRYEYRVNGNGAISNRVIRYAEVKVFDSAGNLYQCLETNNSGQISLNLPPNTGNYTVRIASRGNSTNVKAYVMNDPWNNSVYSITSTVPSTVNASYTMTAPAASAGPVTGGAFNIFDMILKANEYLRTTTVLAPCQTGNTNGCTSFTVAPLLYAYWKKGFNPNTYLGPGHSATNGVSYFLRGTNELYILGGINGDVTTQDTDQFDNTIIIHEYGHFIEDTYAKTDSQGGVHYGDTVIDPRLAWSEAFANFFQAAVQNNPLYLDSKGNIDGTASDYINENLETYDTVDNPATIAAGEGVFHEFSLTRALWDTIDAANDSETVQSPFSEIWAILTSATIGFKDPTLNFRSSGLFFKLQNARHTADSANWKDWSAIMVNEDQKADQSGYATPLTIPGACGAITISPAWNDGSLEGSDLFRDNDFYQYYHPGGSFHVHLAYTAGVNPADLNLLIWKNGYRWTNSSDIVASSMVQDLTSGAHSEDVNLTLPAGLYMINVWADTSQLSGPPSPSTYNLTVGGQAACPTPGG
jgi:hypothetical protein